MVVVALRRLIPFACPINGSTAWSCDLVLALGATAAVIQTDDILLCHTQGINDHHHRPPAHKQQQVGWLAAISNVQRIINIVIMGERERAIQNLSTHYTEWEKQHHQHLKSIDRSLHYLVMFRLVLILRYLYIRTYLCGQQSLWDRWAFIKFIRP